MLTRAGWAGVLLPSVDRVGRYFPLTVAAAFAAEALDAPATLARLAPWLDSIESRALEALQPDLDLELFDRRLAELALPAEAAVSATASDDTVPLGGLAEAFEVWPLAPERPDALDELLRGGALARRASAALWMTRGGEAFPPTLALCTGLMSGERFCALLDGRWSEHAWSAPAQALYCDPKNRGVDLIHGQGLQGGEVEPLAASPSSNNGTKMNAGLGEGSSS
jgi:type VI secretion system protein ImpM